MQSCAVVCSSACRFVCSTGERGPTSQEGVAFRHSVEDSAREMLRNKLQSEELHLATTPKAVTEGNTLISCMTQAWE